MHIKKNTYSITEREVCEILGEYTHGHGLKRHPSERKIYNIFVETAETIANTVTDDSFWIQKKIVLAIAIRFKAEEYLYSKLIEAGMTVDQLFSVKGSQTGKWTQEYKRLFPDDLNQYLIDEINVVSPEAIHVNSFMYKPPIDMSVVHLRELYIQCKSNLIN